MNKQTSHRLFAVILSAVMLSAAASRGAAQGSTDAQVAAIEAVNALPASDGVILVNAQRLLQEALPRVFPWEVIGELNSLSDYLWLQAGVDPRQIKSIAFGFRAAKLITSRQIPDYYFILKGTFNPERMAQTLRASKSSRFREEQYRGRSIYLFDLDLILGSPPSDPLPSFLRGISLSVLDDSTLVVGGLTDVRRAIEAADGQGRINPNLVKLATLTPDALITFAILGLKAVEPGPVMTNWQTEDELTRALEAIDQLSASLTLKTRGFEFVLFARTRNARQSQALKDVLVPLIHQSAGLIADKRLRAVVDALEVSTQENVLHARMEISHTLVAALITESQAPTPRIKSNKTKGKRRR